MTPKFYASKIAGKLKFEKPELFSAFVAGLKPNVRQEITIKKYVKHHTDPQRRYYFGVIVKMIADHTGMTKDEAHAGLKQKFLSVEHESLPTVKSTKKLSTVEFNKYIENCVMFAAEFLSIVIPDPYYVEF